MVRRIEQTLTVKDLIEILKQYPEDSYIAIGYDIARYHDGSIKSTIEIRDDLEWEHTNFPYDREGFKYINLD